MRLSVLIWSTLLLVGCAGKPAQAPGPARNAVITGPSGGALEAGGSRSEASLAIPVLASNPTWGSRTALVTIVEFGDFECPFCAQADRTIVELEKAYGPTDLRVVWKHLPLPFHPHARPAAEAGQGVFTLGGSE